MTGPGSDMWEVLVDSASDAYVSIDSDGHVTRWNLGAAELFGWERDEAVGRLLADLIVPAEYEQAHLLGIRRFVETGRGEAVFRRLQLPALHRSGRRVEVEFTILPVKEEGAGWQFHAFLRDVGAELAQQRYVRLLQEVATAANEATSVEMAVRATVQAVERASSSRLAHAYLLHEGEEPRLVPTGWWFPAPVQPLQQATAGATFAVGEGLPGRVAASGQPECIRDIELDDNFPRADAALASGIRAAFAFPVLTHDRCVAVIELFLDAPGEPPEELLDVTGSVGTQLGRVFERLRGIDELHRVAADREAILSIVGHELRGPLGAAHTATALAVDEVARGALDEATSMLELLDRQLARLRRIVDMFLTAQRLEARSLKADPAPVAVRAVAEQVVAEGDIGGVAVEVDADVQVFVDADHLWQVLWNLLGNAVRHGAAPVRVTAARDGDAVAITVSDRGGGVPPELRGQLFERFARGAKSPGTGLGLAIVRGLARANGGDATYTGSADGAAFTVRLPVP